MYLPQHHLRRSTKGLRHLVQRKCLSNWSVFVPLVRRISSNRVFTDNLWWEPGNFTGVFDTDEVVEVFALRSTRKSVNQEHSISLKYYHVIKYGYHLELCFHVVQLQAAWKKMGTASHWSKLATFHWLKMKLPQFEKEACKSRGLHEWMNV